MKKSAATLAALALVAGASATAVPAQAAAKPVRYANCAAMHKAHPHGVRASASTKDRARRNGRVVMKASRATVDAKLYKLNSSRLDADRDGIACER